MERTHGVWLQRTLIVALGVILVLLPLHGFISTWGGTTIGPLPIWKSWKELLLLAMLPLLFAYCHARPEVAKRVSSSWLTRLVLLYVLINLGFAALSPASPAAVAAGLLMNLRFVAILLLAMVVAAANDGWMDKVKKWLEPWLFMTTIVLALLAIAQVTVLPKDFLVQFGYDTNTTIAPYVLVDDNTDALRAFSTMRGPNPLGAYLILPLILAALAMWREPRNMLAGLALGLGTAGLVMTSSRSAWLGVLVALLVLIALSEPFKKLLTGMAWLLVPVVSLGFIFLWVAANVPSLRLAVFHSSTGDLSLTEGSINAHFRATTDGIVDALNHPLGQGVGTSGPATAYNTATEPRMPENYFVQLAQEVGFIGLALFVAICSVLSYKLWLRRRETWPRVLLASFVGLMVVNLFLHGWSDDPTAMTWWAIAGLFVFAQPKADTKDKAKEIT